MERSPASNLTPQYSELFYRSLNEHFDLWLVIFDNAENDNAIRTYLPKRTERLPEQKLEEQSARPARHILITSRAKKWGDDVGSVELNLFSPEEALKYLKSHLPASISEGCDTELKQIITLQGSLPLGLAQASAYIVSQKHFFSDIFTRLQRCPRRIVSRRRNNRQRHLVKNSLCKLKFIPNKIITYSTKLTVCMQLLITR